MYSYKDYINIEDIWKKFLSGDSHALDIIVKSHYNLLYQYGRKFTHDEGLVKDCIQDLFLDLWQKRRSIHETPSVRNYLMKSLRRRLQRALSKRKPFISSDAGFLIFQPGAELPAEAGLILKEQHAELADKIKKGIDSLTRRQQEIIYLRYYLNADAGQIADIMQLGRQSVYNLLHEAIDKLRITSELYFKPVRFPGALLVAVLLSSTI
jgi:RNA polymerase sigma factor (sigma-70 family)